MNYEWIRREEQFFLCPLVMLCFRGQVRWPYRWSLALGWGWWIVVIRWGNRA